MRPGDFMIRAVWPGERRKRIRESLIAAGLGVLFFAFLCWVLVTSAIA